MEPTDAAAGDPGHGKRMSGRVYTTLVNVYLHKSEAEIEALHTHAPIVHVLYYPSKHGAANLAHFAAVAPKTNWMYTSSLDAFGEEESE